MVQAGKYIEHIASCGEMWDNIALQYYNDEHLVAVLLEANRSICDILVFEGGEKVRVPVIAERELTASLPPWRR